MTFYIGMIDAAEDGSWGLTFPDLPGCTSAGADLDKLFTNGAEAVRLWAEDAVSDGEVLPAPRTIAALLDDPDVKDTIREIGPVSFVQVPLLLDAGRSVRANLSIDAGLLKAIDDAAEQRGLTRSSFLASAAKEKIAKGA